MKRPFLCFLTLVAPLLAVGCASTVRPAASSTGTFQFVQLCDTQLGFSQYDEDVRAFRAAVAQVNARQPAFVIICGDLMNDCGNAKAIQEFLAVRAEFKMPVYCVPGNHDVGLPANAVTLKQYRDRLGPDHVTFEHQGWTFLGLDTQALTPADASEANAQQLWLRQTLTTAQNDHHPVVVFGHIPPFIATPDEKPEYFNYPQPLRQEMLELFRTHGVAAVLSGHTHQQTTATVDGILFFTGATTSVNFDKKPRGFTLWTAGPGHRLKPEYIPLPSR